MFSSTSDNGIDRQPPPSTAHSTTSKPSTIVKYLDTSSGSDDDLGLEARRIMRARKKEQQHMQSLGPLVPIDGENSNDDDSVSTNNDRTSSEISFSRLPIPLRVKRAETELIVTQCLAELYALRLKTLESSSDSRKSSLIDPNRKASRKSVGYSVVEARFDDDDDSDERDD